MSGETTRPATEGPPLGAAAVKLPLDAASVKLDRREFFGRVALVAGGIAVTAAVPWPVARALAASAAAQTRVPSGLADWSIDDQWAPSPRYADPIGYPAQGGWASVRAIREPTAGAASVGSIEALFYA